MKTIKILFIVFFFDSLALGQIKECPRIETSDLSKKSKSYVEIQAGGSEKNRLKEESVGSFDLEAQRKRISECGSGASKCFDQFPANIKNGEFLITYKVKDGPQGIPEVKSMEITSQDFTQKEHISCLKEYWSQFVIPNVGSIRGFEGGATVSVAVKKISSTSAGK